VPLVIAIFIAITIAVAFWVLLPRLREHRVVFNIAPDQPCSFGCDMSWLAIKTNDPNAVISALGAIEQTQANWDCGLGAAYDLELGQSHLFVSAPTRGWVFVVGSALPYPTGPAYVDKWTPFLTELANQFQEVQYFASFPDIDLFAWARLADGKWQRAFAVSDEGVIWTRGRLSRDERQLGLKLFELRGVRGRKGDAGGELLMHPTQEHVMRLAEQWSLNPTLLDSLNLSPSIGMAVIAPRSWRPERILANLRKTG
jgi:hypothetical protein